MKKLFDQLFLKKNLLVWSLLSFIFLSVFFVIFNSRQIFFFKYEPEYYENLYYHSQWNIPNSNRGISDGLLYQFVGYRLVQGENTFYLNYETPPFGKYLYGLSEYFFGNPYWVSLILYLISIAAFFYLSKEIFKNKKLILSSLLLFTTTPFMATQVRDTMLDLPLTAFFLIHIFFFMKFLSKPKVLFLGLSGIFLGLATGTKIGVYSPGIILLGLPLVFWASKKILNPLIYLIAIFAGYGFSYISYFLHHPNPIPWIKLHQKQLDFYLGPSGEVDHLNQWRGIFMNSYQGWWGIDKMTLGDWSPILPLGVIAAVVVLILAIKKREKIWIYLSGITLIFLIVNTFISFYPRYLMPAVPGFILLITYFAKKYWWVLVILSILNLPFLWSSLATKNRTENAQGIANFISKRAYRELYRSIDPEQRNNIPEEKFINTMENFYETLGVRKIDAKVTDITQTGKNINVRYETQYLTDYGKINFDPVFKFKDVHNQIVLIWEWKYLWPGYSPDKEIIVESHGAITSNSQRDQAEKVYIITRHVQWPDTLNKLAEVIDIPGGVEVGERVNWVVPDDFPRYIGILKKDLSGERRKKVLEIKGVELKEIELDLITDIYFENYGEREYIIKSGILKLENFR